MDAIGRWKRGAIRSGRGTMKGKVVLGRWSIQHYGGNQGYSGMMRYFKNE
jgi:hypothetical protein